MNLRSFLIVIVILFFSCDELEKLFPKSSFDAAYPKANLNVEPVFGSYLVIKKDNDTLYLRISGTKNNNTVYNLLTGDTLFDGKISLDKGLYYFSQPVNDTSFFIYAIKLKSNLIYGLNSVYEQAFQIDREIINGNYPKLVKYIGPSYHPIRLHPDETELNKLFLTIIDSIIPDTIIYSSARVPIIKPKLTL